MQLLPVILRHLRLPVLSRLDSYKQQLRARKTAKRSTHMPFSEGSYLELCPLGGESHVTIQRPQRVYTGAYEAAGPFIYNSANVQPMVASRI